MLSMIVAGKFFEKDQPHYEHREERERNGESHYQQREKREQNDPSHYQHREERKQNDQSHYQHRKVGKRHGQSTTSIEKSESGKPRNSDVLSRKWLKQE